MNKCQNCGHEWFPRQDHMPKRCPRCKAVMLLKARKSAFNFSDIPAGACRFYAMADLMKIQNWSDVWKREWRTAKRKNPDLVNLGGFGGVRVVNKKSPDD